MSNAVKFAKYIPDQGESEKCLQQTKEMINEINKNPQSKKQKVIFDYFNDITFGQPLFLSCLHLSLFLFIGKLQRAKSNLLP